MNQHRSRSRDPTVPQHGMELLIKDNKKENYRRNQVMKKLLTIMTLVLALCMAFTSALAMEYDINWDAKPADKQLLIDVPVGEDEEQNPIFAQTTVNRWIDNGDPIIGDWGSDEAVWKFHYDGALDGQDYTWAVNEYDQDEPILVEWICLPPWDDGQEAGFEYEGQWYTVVKTYDKDGDDYVLGEDGEWSYKWLEKNFGIDMTEQAEAYFNQGGEPEPVVEHDFNFNKENPLESKDEYHIVFVWPMDANNAVEGEYTNGFMRVYCKNHWIKNIDEDGNPVLNDNDVEEYTIYESAHEYADWEDVWDELIANNFAKDGVTYVNYVAPDCENGKDGSIQRRCIAPRGEESLKHEYEDVYSAHDPFCSNAEPKTVIEWGHIWSDDEEKGVEDPADMYKEIGDKRTCTTGGILAPYCLVCGKVDTSRQFEVGPLNHHNPDGTLPEFTERTTPATCIDEGLVEKICPLCHESLTEDECNELGMEGYPQKTPINPEAHLWPRLSNGDYDWVLDRYVRDDDGNPILPTCTEPGLGIFHHICLRCNAVEGNEEREIPAHGHDYGDWIYDEEATCVSGYKRHAVCSYDNTHILTEDHTGENDPKYLNPQNHPKDQLELLAEVEYGGETVYSCDPTCTEEGIYWYRCNACNAVFYENIAPLGHLPSDEKEDIEGWCNDYSYVGATCCKRCGEILSYDDKFVTPHIWDNWVKRNDYNPATGMKEYWIRYCKRCLTPEQLFFDKDDNHLDDPDWAPEAHTHEFVFVPGVEPTCTAPGKTDAWQCACGEYYGDPAVVLDPLGHDIVYTNEVASTCTVAGHTAGVQCARCGEWIIKETKLPLKAHNATVKIDGKEPGCEVTGLTDGWKCADCGEIVVPQQEIPATGHKAKAEPAVEPTCTEPGVAAKSVCEICGAEIEGGAEIPALGHDLIETVKEAATCTNEGLIEITCSRCDYKANKVVPKLAHDDEKIIVEDATCTENGVMKLVCKVCKRVAFEEIPAKNHPADKQVEVPAVAPTCTETGLTAGLKCTECGEFTLKQETIPAKGHVEETIPGKDATCAVAGLTEGTKCKVCGEIIVAQEIIPATGKHDYVKDAGIPATCTEKGTTDGVICSVCGDILVGKEEIPALGHDIVKVEGKAPTCTEAGYTESSYCSRCDLKVEAQPLEATGHDLEKKVVKADDFGNELEVLYTCKNCDYSKTEYRPVYEVKDVEYDEDNWTATGKVELVKGEAKKVYARVAFFCKGGACLVEIRPVDENGNFKAGFMGDYEHISVLIVDDDTLYNAAAAIKNAYNNGLN